ncbi:MAG TPA: cache domain-containing protein [Anaerolineales bacterium]
MEDTTPRSARSRFHVRLPVSLRTRLIAANILIVGVSIAVLGYYVFYRGQQESAVLGNALANSIRQKAIDDMTAESAKQTQTLDGAFVAVRQSITNVGMSASLLLSHQAQFSSNSYWDASTSLARLPKGSWNNPDHQEPASVFIPAREDLSATLISELNTLKQLDFTVPNILATNPDVVAIYFGGTSGETLYYPNIDLANVVPPDFDVTQRTWYVAAAPAHNESRNAVWSTPYLDAARHGLVITSSYPVFDASGGFRGVVAMDVQLTRVSALVSNIHLGKTGYAFIVDRDGRLIAMPDSGYRDLGYTAEQMPLGQTFDQDKLQKPLPSDLVASVLKMRTGQSDIGTIQINGQQRFVVYRPIPDVGYSLAMMVPTEEVLVDPTHARQTNARTAAETQRISFALMGVILGLAVLSALAIGNTLISPLLGLTATADEIAKGNLEARAQVRGNDEIATLGQTLNAMAARLMEMIQSLEGRVKDRTAALEVASANAGRRAAQFEAITQVTRAISSIRNMDELMPLITAVISQYLGFYHVGVFLNDEGNENTWLIASNSEGGHRMLLRHHNLKIGVQGIVGYVAAHGESRVARSVGKDAVFFNNPDLPETKSEAALPLRRGQQIAGVLDVQSTKEDAFSDEDLSILAILADQVSLAMENTRLFETTRRSLIEAETLYRQYVQEAWGRLPQDGQVTGYRYTPRGVSPLVGPVNPESVGASSGGNEAHPEPLVVPIKLRGETIGNLIVQSIRGGGWTQDQIELAQAVAERVALSAENARLFDETNRRAERERLVTEITSRIRSSNDPDEMIRTAVEELRNALGATEIQVIPQVVPASAQGPGDTATAVAPDAASPRSQRPHRGNGAQQ